MYSFFLSLDNNSTSFDEPSLFSILVLTKHILMVFEDVFVPSARPLSLETPYESPFFSFTLLWVGGGDGQVGEEFFFIILKDLGMEIE